MKTKIPNTAIEITSMKQGLELGGIFDNDGRPRTPNLTAIEWKRRECSN